MNLEVHALLQPIHVGGAVPESVPGELDPSLADTPLPVRVDLEQLSLLIARADYRQFRRGAVVVTDAVLTRKVRVARLNTVTSGGQHREREQQSPELERAADDGERYARQDHLDV